MLRYIARIVLVIAGGIASWFVARDAPNFGAIQLVVGLIFLVWIVVILGFWPSVVSWMRSRSNR